MLLFGLPCIIKRLNGKVRRSASSEDSRTWSSTDLTMEDEKSSPPS